MGDDGEERGKAAYPFNVDYTRRDFYDAFSAADARTSATPLKEHRYPPYEHHFDVLCDGGCGRPVPDGFQHTLDGWRLERLGWRVRPNSTFIDGVERACPVCASFSATP